MSEAKISRAVLANEHAEASVNHFLATFDSVRKSRGPRPGAPIDAEQDLLRAAVVFAAGGLDITVKELIRGALRDLASSDNGVKIEFEKFAYRQLKAEPSLGGKTDPAKFLAQLLVSESPYEKLIESYIYDLTGSSLQSIDELFKASKALGINSNFLRKNEKNLKEAFDTRNKIIHELDTNFEGGVGRRKRKSRRRKELEASANLLLSTAKDFIDQVSTKIIM